MYLTPNSTSTVCYRSWARKTPMKTFRRVLKIGAIVQISCLQPVGIRDSPPLSRNDASGHTTRHMLRSGGASCRRKRHLTLTYYPAWSAGRTYLALPAMAPPQLSGARPHPGPEGANPMYRAFSAIGVRFGLQPFYTTGTLGHLRPAAQPIGPFAY